jgi:hypothetical protein
MHTSLAGVRHQVRNLLAEGHHHTAVEVTRAAVPMFPKLPATTALWLADVLCQAGREANALMTLQLASGRGCAWERGVIDHDPYLQGIRGPELEHVVRVSQRILEREQRSLEPVEPAVLLPRRAPRGVLLCLHGRADQAQPSTARSWRAAGARGFALVIPQSTQLTVWPDRLFGWTDVEQARREVRSAWQTAVGHVAELSKPPLVIGGLSNGADIAVELALSGIPAAAKGFVAVAPAVREIEVHDLSSEAKQLFGTLVVGVWDYRRELALRLWTTLASAGIATQFIGIARVGHAMPQQETFAPRLRLALNETLSHHA